MLNDLDYAIGRPRLLRNFRKKMRCIHTAFTLQDTLYFESNLILILFNLKVCLYC